MRLPRRVVIGHRTYKIRAMPRAMSKALGIDGRCDYALSTIWVLCAGLPPAERANILVHEIGHGCWDAAGLGKRADEERAVTALANVLTQVIRDNPTVWRWITLNSRK